jgi:hypothetical protein
MMGVVENISQSAAEICEGTIMQSSSHNSQIKMFPDTRTFFLVLVCGICAQKFVLAFQLQPVYSSGIKMLTRLELLRDTSTIFDVVTLACDLRQGS